MGETALGIGACRFESEFLVFPNATKPAKGSCQYQQKGLAPNRRICHSKGEESVDCCLEATEVLGGNR